MMNPAEFANIAKAEDDFWWYRGMKEILWRFLDPMAAQRKFTRVLEAGCGTGYLAKAMEQRYSWPIYAVDLGSEGLAYAKRMGAPRPVQADITALPFKKAEFDLVLSMDVIIHLVPGKEEEAMAEFARVLAPGGDLVLRVSALDALRSRHSQFAHEKQRFTKKRLTRLAARHEIRVERCTYANTLLLPVAFAKFRIWEPLSRQPPASGVAPVSP
ncbi:MAG: class I SAM-dependent methyltransferase, partial [Bryobacteraceae bacterium]